MLINEISERTNWTYYGEARRLVLEVIQNICIVDLAPHNKNEVEVILDGTAAPRVDNPDI